MQKPNEAKTFMRLRYAWIYLFGLLQRICDSPRNDEVVGFYFLQKPNEAKTFAKIFLFDFFTRFVQSTNHNRSNGGSALDYFCMK